MDVPQRKTLLLLVAAGLLVAALTLVSRSTRPPGLPPDAVHRNLTRNGYCAPCHGAGADAPLRDRHPPKDDCLRCHPVAG
ncbi:MAG: hypothetical protein P1P84_22335 [Deferrisomatales bacterium]|nr:hypothetical protein [Deferrisomatales bacterium]